MKSLAMLAALLLAGAARAATAVSEPPPIELLPSGKWQVEYAKSSCIISRAFGEGAQKMLFGLKPAPYSDVVSVLVIQPSPKGRGVRGTADVKLSSGFVPGDLRDRKEARTLFARHWQRRKADLVVHFRPRDMDARIRRRVFENRVGAGKSQPFS